MAKRRTIGRDPLSEPAPGETYSAEIVPIARPVLGAASAAVEKLVPAPAPFTSVSEPDKAAGPIPPSEAVVLVDGKARRIVGGRLEILGGALGTGSRAIWPLGTESKIGFVAPNGRTVDLVQELDAALVARDGTEHRYLSAAGWAWVLASFGGFVGLAAAAGLRLLEPRRMMVQMRLADGSTIVARTDSITASGLAALAAGRESATA